MGCAEADVEVVTGAGTVDLVELGPEAEGFVDFFVGDGLAVNVDDGIVEVVVVGGFVGDEVGGFVVPGEVGPVVWVGLDVTVLVVVVVGDGVTSCSQWLLM